MNNKKNQEEIPDILLKEHKNRKNSVEKKLMIKIKKEREINSKNSGNNNSGFNQNNNEENNIFLDEEILKYWEDLKVTDIYKELFCQKLLFFKENIQEIIIKKEKENLRRVHERILIVTSAIISRERALKDFRTLEAIFLSGSYMNSNEILYQAKLVIKEIKTQNLKLFKSLYELQRLFFYDSFHNKYDLSKIPNNYLYKEDFFVKLQEEAKILYESHLGSKLNIRNIFDPLLLYIDDEDPNDLKGLGETLLWLNNNFIYTNYKLPKRYKSFKKFFKFNKKLNIDAGNGKIIHKPGNKHFIQEKIENIDKTSNDNNKNIKNKQIIEYKKKINDKTKNLINSNSNNSLGNKNIINTLANNNIINNHLVIDATRIPPPTEEEKQGLSFYQGKLSDLEKIYNDFYNEVPENIKITFNLKSDINTYSEGIFPMIILEKEKNKLVSFISLQLSNDKENSISINSLGTLRNVQECIQDVINLLSTKEIMYHLLLIDLHYKKENNKYELDKEINLIFKLLKFRWLKLENLEGSRFQKMKYTNPYWKNDEENNIKLPIYLFELKSSLLISTGNKNENNFNTNNTNYLKEKEINKFNLNICENIYSENKEELEKLYKSISGIDLDEDESIQNIYDKIKKKNLTVFNINNISLTKNYWSYFDLESQVNSISIVNLDNRKYIRIKDDIQNLYDKENDQEFYMFLSSNGNAYIFGHINNQTKAKIINEFDNNLYTYFKFIYSKLNKNENKEINCLYIPEFKFEKNININQINSSIKNIVNVEFSSKIISNNSENVKNFKTIKYDLEKTDVILEKPFFLSGINIYLQNDNPILFCSLIE